MEEITIERLPSGVWFWRKGSKHRWVIPGPGRWAIKLGSAESAELMNNPNELVLIDPNWCHVGFEQLLWPPNVTCPVCGDDSNNGKTLEDLKLGSSHTSKSFVNRGCEYRIAAYPPTIK